MNQWILQVECIILGLLEGRCVCWHNEGLLKEDGQVGYTVFFSNSLIYWKSIVWLASQYNALSGLRYTLERFILQTVHYSACYIDNSMSKK